MSEKSLRKHCFLRVPVTREVISTDCFLDLRFLLHCMYICVLFMNHIFLDMSGVFHDGI